MIVATGSRPRHPFWAGTAEEEGIRVADVTDVLEGRAVPEGDVLVVDEVGFHQATSVAELLADRGCDVEIATPGMVVGQDLGITLDLEGFNMRAAGKHITQSTDRVVMGASDGALQLLAPPDGDNRDPPGRLGRPRLAGGAGGRPLSRVAASRPIRRRVPGGRLRGTSASSTPQ